MVNKCYVIKCRAGYINGSVRPKFSSPLNTDHRQRLIKFIYYQKFLLFLLQEFVTITSNLNTIHNGYSDNGYSDILDIV